MRKKFILSCILIFFLVNGFSQEERFNVRSGAGYYMDVFTSDKGPIIWLEGGYRLKTGFTINGRISMANMEWKLNYGTFKDYKTIQLRQMCDLVLSRQLKLKGNNYFEPGIGFKLKKEYFLYPDVDEIYSGGVYYQDLGYSQIFYEIGFTLCLDYYYQFESNFYLGLRADSNVIWALGFEGLSVTPIFGFRF